ncbi:MULTISPECIES: hypothetical protein [unclassified Gilliamella]|uniref:DUF7336 domain-containing protein n=1 Tax=unclassified Gilliamella TaxID=2685620 RepID=UPI000A334E6C|nr:MULTISPECIES: hypothetical protein [unclassified Gilliamella]OTQ70172.1 hypothetical protein B6C99_12910 [Gilliamella sp. N-G2]OTQ76458.1 hypothetical protein B6D23_12670 [Gilliamella sp. N-W3]
MQKIYYLYHVRYEDTDDEDFRIIGIYSSSKQAKLAIERMKKKPGFIDFPNGFQIIPSVLNRAEWLDGFVTC